MVGSRAVFLHPPAELGEQQYHNFFVGVVLFQVLVEVADGGGHVGPQLGEGGGLVGVGVEGAWIYASVEHAGPEVGKVHLSDALHPLGQGAAAVLHAGGVHLGCRFEDVSAFKDVQSSLGKVVAHGA